VTTSWIDPSRHRRAATRRRVVVCGSMSSLSRMDEIRQTLHLADVPAVTPSPDNDIWLNLAPTDVAEKKRLASLRHIRRILHHTTAAVLVMNLDKYGTQDYIGPNAFAEIAVAFAHGRQVFLFQGMPDQYADELMAWGVTCLYCDIAALVDAMHQTNERVVDDGQLALFR
jgi:hypothetical protein